MAAAIADRGFARRQRTCRVRCAHWPRRPTPPVPQICGSLRTCSTANRSRRPPRRWRQAVSLAVVLMAISPYAVHPVYAAMAAATLEELFPRRVQLCFGVGAPGGLEAAGTRCRASDRDAARSARSDASSFLSGEAVKFAGRRYRISGRARHGRASAAAVARRIRSANARARRRNRRWRRHQRRHSPGIHRLVPG